MSELILSIAAKYLMLLDADPDTPTYDNAPNFNYPSQKMNAEFISLDNDDGVGDLRANCLTGLRNLPWTPYTAYGVGGPVGGITCFTLLFTSRRRIFWKVILPLCR